MTSATIVHAAASRAFNAEPFIDQLLLQPDITTFCKAEYRVFLSGDKAGVVYTPFYSNIQGAYFCKPGHIYSELWRSDGSAHTGSIRSITQSLATYPMPLYNSLVSFARDARNKLSQAGDIEMFAKAFARVDVLVLHKYNRGSDEVKELCSFIVLI